MRKRLNDIFKSSTVRQSVITSTSTFLTAALGAVYYLLLAKILGPEKYGVFSLSLQVIMALTPLADLGTGTAVVRFIGSRPADFQLFTSVAFRMKLATGLLSVFVLTVFSRQISEIILKQPILSPLMWLIGIGILVLMLFNLATSILQGLQKFIPWGSIQIGSNIFRLLILVTMYLLNLLDPTTALVLFIVSFMFGVLMSLRWINKSLLMSKIDRGTFYEFWKFNRWTALFTISAAITSRLDAFFTARYLDITQIGIYSLAITMSSFLPQFAGALGAVTAPKFSRLSDPVESHKYLLKALPFALAVSIGVAVLMVPVGLGVVWFTGRDFSSSLQPFLVLLISMAIFAGSGPLRDSILYAHKKPQVFFIASIVQGVVVTLFSIVLIPKYGILGASYSSLFSQISILVIVISSYLFINHKK